MATNLLQGLQSPRYHFMEECHLPYELMYMLLVCM